MFDIPDLLRMLQDKNPIKRYDACEELRVAPSIPEKAIDTLQEATHDSDRDVADAANRALAIHLAARLNRQSVVEVPLSTPELTLTPMPTSSPSTSEYVFALERRVMAAEVEICRLSDALQQTAEQSKNMLSKLPNTAIVSPRFLSRAFAVWGHLFVAQLIIALPVYLIVFALAMSANRP